MAADSQDYIVYQAAGGVVVDRNRVLLLYRPSLGEVRLPKGHIDPGETAAEAALREVMEESGLNGLTITADLGTQDVSFVHDGRPILRRERYFLIQLNGREPPPGAPEPQFEPRWHSWEEAEANLTFEEEKEWVRRARAVHDRRAGSQAA